MPDPDVANVLIHVIKALNRLALVMEKQLAHDQEMAALQERRRRRR